VQVAATAGLSMSVRSGPVTTAVNGTPVARPAARVSLPSSHDETRRTGAVRPRDSVRASVYVCRGSRTLRRA
jgi:hypothetical protein